MITILLSIIKIVTLIIFDKVLEILEDCMDLNHYNDSLSRLIDLAIYYKESISHK
jgi:hypothetical protein